MRSRLRTLAYPLLALLATGRAAGDSTEEKIRVIEQINLGLGVREIALPKQEALANCPTCASNDGRRYFKSPWAAKEFLAENCAVLTGKGDFTLDDKECRELSMWVGQELAKLRSTISYEDFQQLYRFLAAQKLPFRYPEEGCYARAHRMARLMEEYGVESRKIFIKDKSDDGLEARTAWSPEGKVSWIYHVAPIVNVEMPDGRKVDLVIDPSLSGHGLSIEQWKGLMTKKSCPIVQEKIGIDFASCKIVVTDRFKLYPRQLGTEIAGWTEENEEDVADAIAEYEPIAEQRLAHRLRRRMK